MHFRSGGMVVATAAGMARKSGGADAADIRRVAREKFGYDNLRPGQEHVIRLILDKRDTLSVMPTGSGKSAIYQIAGLKIGGPTVVVSPLIALQKDQLEYIQEQDLAEAAVVNSMLRAGERREAFEKLEDGELEYLFLAPEQLANEQTMEKLKASPPSLFVVDEAHCISEWGHSFRPEYARLGTVIEALGHPTVLALTATAAPKVREDILERLGMRHAQVVVWGFDRPNIWMGVEPCPDESTKHRVLLQRVTDEHKPMIVYVATQAHAEQLAADLNEQGIKAAFYHGGMKKGERDAAQDAFMGNAVEVVVATNAFGMGVDKANVRTVIHYDISESVDSYYQEIGRSGRDGEPARAILLYRPEDLGMRRALAAGGKLTEQQVSEVAELVAGRDDPLAVKDLKEQTDVPPGKVTAALGRLEDAGVVELRPGGEVATVAEKIDVDAVAEEAAREHELYRQYRQARVELIKDYAETRDCRRRYLLNYFGETSEARACGNCDNCDAGTVEKEEAKNEKLPFALKSRVKHQKYGQGTVMKYEADKIVVLFEEQGVKSLVTEFVVENGLLEKE
jgi:ATP-dependent DNA helicase RecQ